MQTTKKSSGWHLRDVIMLTLIAIFFGFIFWIWAFAYDAVAATPLKPFANDITLGAWIMAGPLAGYLLRKAGASFLGEFLAAFAEMIIGSQWGVSTLLSGLIQGIGGELGFALTGYKKWNSFSLVLSTLTSTIVTFGYDLYASGYTSYSLGMLITLFIIRFLSIGFFGGVLVAAITKLIDKSGILNR
ncbi:ECF transporter S component [Periweissella fabaria]|uniref:HMP/thiamine permease protein YkoE n=1 Tax=Periweissella fabaria TaxID=546157 RepID=A0ABM8Z6C5_9LACO|nr:ECF transporter S component [Periweissella fabaria]MCM0597609.1 ECF transporter S component [Periweissella fabaria]CAH0416792.1 Putative HMP/thiamine permease protein YkoE [Periweissella fabaria]